MKNLKYTLFTAALSVAMTAGFSSCSDSFLDEKNKSSYTTDYFKTSQGIQDLATALYGNIRWHFGYEWAYGIIGAAVGSQQNCRRAGRKCNFCTS